MAQYFKNFPKTIYSLENKVNGVDSVTSIVSRFALEQSFKQNTSVYEKYNIQESDTPEIIAHKYYGDVYRYWMVLYGNTNIIDPQWDWPLNSQQFTIYLQNKYAEDAGGANNVLAYTSQTVHHYEKIITTTDNDSNTIAIKNIEVDHDTFLEIIPFTETRTFSDGTSATMSVSSKIVSIYEYENYLNEAKRNIKIINSAYASDLETQYQVLVNQ